MQYRCVSVYVMNVCVCKYVKYGYGMRYGYIYIHTDICMYLGDQVNTYS